MRIELRKKKIDGRSVNIPFLLSVAEDNDAITSMINILENSLGQKEADLDKFFIMELFPSRKIGRSVLDSVFKWFYNPKGLDIIDSKTPSNWRIELFEFMYSKGISYVNESERFDLLQKFANEHDIVTNDIEKTIFGDHKTNYRVIRRDDKPSVIDIVSRYNSDVIYQIFKSSSKFWLKLSSDQISPTLVKNMFRNAKMWGIFVEITKDDKSVNFTAIGPQEIIGSSTKYGKLLYALFYSLVSTIDKKTDVFVNMKTKTSTKTVKLPIHQFSSLLPVKDVFSKNLETTFDSAVEQRFIAEFKKLIPNWEIEQEYVLIEQNYVFVPDFRAVYRGQVVYIEIVGFWTDQYLKKKTEKLKIFSKYYDNIIVIVDSILDFDHSIVPTFDYSDVLPMKQLSEYLHNTYGFDVLQKYIETILNSLETYNRAIAEILLDEKILEEDQLIEIFGAKSSDELQSILERVYEVESSTNELIIVGPVEVSGDNVSYVIIRAHNLIIEFKYLKHIQSKIADIVPSNGINYETLISRLQLEIDISDQLIEILLRQFDYSLQYLSLTDITVFPPVNE